MVEMFHPDLDATITVQERAVEIHERKGWLRVVEANDIDVPDEDGEKEE
jgi:hypothetical protein